MRPSQLEVHQRQLTKCHKLDQLATLCTYLHLIDILLLIGSILRCNHTLLHDRAYSIYYEPNYTLAYSGIR